MVEGCSLTHAPSAPTGPHDQIVASRVHHLDVHERAGGERRGVAVREEHHRVHVRGLARQPALQHQVVLRSTGRPPRRAPPARCAPSGAGRPSAAAACITRRCRRRFTACRHVVLQCRGCRALLVRVREHADVVELDRPDEIHELVDVRLGLAGEPDDERRAQRDAGHARDAGGPAGARSCAGCQAAACVSARPPTRAAAAGRRTGRPSRSPPSRRARRRVIVVG